MPDRTSKSSLLKKKKSKRTREDVDEERELEARLFGTQKHSKVPTTSRAFDDDEEDTGMGWLQDDQVSYPLTLFYGRQRESNV